MKRVSISGPFRGATPWDIKRNVDNAEAIALASWRAGAATYCPHTSTRNFQDAAPDAVWLAGHIEWMQLSDGALLLPNWRQSSGTCAEVQMFAERNIPMFVASSISDNPSDLATAYALSPTTHRLDIASNFLDWLAS